MRIYSKLVSIIFLLAATAQHSIAQSTLPTATVSGDASVCQNSISPLITFTGANGTAPYTFYYTFSQGLGEQSVTSTNGSQMRVIKLVKGN